MPSAIRVIAIRFAAILFGGMASGLAGAYMSLVLHARCGRRT